MIGTGRGALVLWILLLGGSAIVLSQMTMTTDMTALLPRAADATQHLLISQLREGIAARLLLIALEGAPAEVLAERSRRVAKALRTSGLFAYVGNGGPEELAALRSILMRHRYRLSPVVESERFTAEALRAALQRQLQMLGSAAGALAKPTLSSDPTGEVSQILSEMQNGSRPPLRHGVWFSKDERRALLVVETAAPGSDLDKQAEAISAVRDVVAAAGLPDSARLLMTGPGVFAVDARKTIEADTWRLSLMAGGLVTVLLMSVYRSALPVALSALPVLTGLVVGVALVQQIFGFVHGITLGFGATLIGEAVDYPAYTLLHARVGERLVDTVSRIWPTLRLAVFTTIFGTLSLLLSSFTGLAQLGVLSVAGVGAAGFVTRWVLPAVAKRPADPSKVRAIPMDFSRPFQSSRYVAPVVWLLFIVVLIVLAIRNAQIWDDDLANLSPISQAEKSLDEELRKEMGAPDVRYLLVIRGEDQEQVLVRSERAAGMLDALVRDGLLAGYELPSDYLPSRHSQAKRRAALPAPAPLRAALSEALHGLPFREGLFEPFLKDVEEARVGRDLDLAEVRVSALGLKLRSLLFSQDKEWVALAPLRGVTSAGAMGDRVKAAESTGVTFLDLKAEAERMVRSYRGEALRLTGLGIVAIAAVLYYGLRSPRRVVRVLLPVFMAVAFAVFTLTSSGTRLSLFHLVSLLLVVGIGLNYALFFNRTFTDEADRQRTLLALTVCIGATLSAFGMLALSRTPVLHAIGLTVTLGAVFSLLFSMILARRGESA